MTYNTKIVEDKDQALIQTQALDIDKGIMTEGNNLQKENKSTQITSCNKKCLLNIHKEEMN